MSSDLASIQRHLVGIEGQLAHLLSELRAALRRVNLTEAERLRLEVKIETVEAIAVDMTARMVDLRRDHDRLAETIQDRLKDHT